MKPLAARVAGHPAREGIGRDTFRIIGIDPGTVRLGYGVIDAEGPSRIRYVECGVITAPPTQARALRLVEIGRGLRELFLEMHPAAIAMEEAFFGKNVQAALALGEARGVALLVAGEAGVSICGYSPATVKKAVVGHGRATKDQIAYLVRATLQLRRVPTPDAADALAIAICHARNRAPVAIAVSVAGATRRVVS